MNIKKQDNDVNHQKIQKTSSKRDFSRKRRNENLQLKLHRTTGRSHGKSKDL